jgi:carbonic anhydrase/acetyltransferase-like protein (isoleucine patch superfamily)
MFYQLGESRPSIASEVFVADNASVIGDVELRSRSSVWFGAVLRGDNHRITVGEESNIQDGAVLHTDAGIELTLGRGITVGHQAMLHGCVVGDFTLIGIHAVVLNRARIGHHCIIGAHTLVPEGMDIPDGSLVVGAPAAIKRALSPQQQQLLEASATHYVANAKRYRQDLKVIEL